MSSPGPPIEVGMAHMRHTDPKTYMGYGELDESELREGLVTHEGLLKLDEQSFAGVVQKPHVQSQENPETPPSKKQKAARPTTHEGAPSERSVGSFDMMDPNTCSPSSSSTCNTSTFVSMDPSMGERDNITLMITQFEAKLIDLGMSMADIPFDDVDEMRRFLRDLGYLNTIERAKLIRILREYSTS